MLFFTRDNLVLCFLVYWLTLGFSMYGSNALCSATVSCGAIALHHAGSCQNATIIMSPRIFQHTFKLPFEFLLLFLFFLLIYIYLFILFNILCCFIVFIFIYVFIYLFNFLRLLVLSVVVTQIFFRELFPQFGSGFTAYWWMTIKPNILFVMSIVYFLC